MIGSILGQAGRPPRSGLKRSVLWGIVFLMLENGRGFEVALTVGGSGQYRLTDRVVAGREAGALN